MRNLRRNIQLKDGVEVATLFTPHLFSFKEDRGLSLEVKEDNPLEIMEAYADVYFLAAINAWVLDGKGDADSFPYTRGDFHAYMTANPRVFGKAVDFAVEALTGKSVRDLSAEQVKVDSGAVSGAKEGKKKRWRLIGRR